MFYCVKKTETEEVTRYFINTYSRTPYIQNRHDWNLRVAVLLSLWACQNFKNDS